MSKKIKKLQLKRRNYLVAIVMRKAVQKHKDRKRQSKHIRRINMQNNHLQDELDYLELITHVASFDKEAAEYMLTEMREIEGFGPCGDLWEVVVWQNTKQGTDYWYNISLQLEQ